MSTTHAESLSAELSGRVVAPGDDDWDAARQAFNLALDQRPELVAFPADAQDVTRAVRFATAQGLRVAAHRTGSAPDRPIPILTPRRSSDRPLA